MIASASGPEEPFALGVCFYPEQWPAERWPAYAQQMRALGLTYVRIAEFAWSLIEPEPGRYDWAWLDAAIDLLAAAGLRVVLCTPTAAPPAWLVQAHPEILPWDRAGRPRTFGSRRHYDPASPVYRAHSRRITTALATRYGTHPAVAGWQTDNEFGDHDTARSYSPAARDAFRLWLAERYETVADLNAAWGTVFWSQQYSDFDQIDLPNLSVAEPNPAHALDFYRFSSDMLARFHDEQIAILRRLSPGRWITHNFMRLQHDFDHYQVAHNLDFAAWDSYPTGAVEYSSLSTSDKRRFARTGEPDLIGFNHDLYYGVGGGRPFWVMEQQAGQINWAPSNALPAAGAVALWTAQAWAHGANVVSYFRWRAATVAQEALHSGLLRHDETLDRGGEEVAALDTSAWDTAPLQREVALLHDYACLWAYDEQPHSAAASYWEQVMLFYRALRSLGVDVAVRYADSDLSGYRLIVAPALTIVDEARATHLARYAPSAHLVFGPRAGSRTPNGNMHPSGQPGPLADLLGCRLRNFDGMPPWLSVEVDAYTVTTWAESYQLAGGTALHTYSSGPLSGQPAVVRHGGVTTIGAWCAELVRDLLASELQQLGIPTLDLPMGVRVSRRGQSTLWQNFTPELVTLPDGTTLAPVSYRLDSTRS